MQSSYLSKLIICHSIHPFLSFVVNNPAMIHSQRMTKLLKNNHWLYASSDQIEVTVLDTKRSMILHELLRTANAWHLLSSNAHLSWKNTYSICEWYVRIVFILNPMIIVFCGNIIAPLHQAQMKNTGKIWVVWKRMQLRGGEREDARENEFF